MKIKKLLCGRNFFPKDHVEVGSKKNNAEAWKNKKKKKQTQMEQIHKALFVLLPKVTWLRQSPRACFLTTSKEKTRGKPEKTEPSSNSVHCTLYA